MKYYCIDCGKEISRKEYKRCPNCFDKKHSKKMEGKGIPQKAWDIHWMGFAKAISKYSKCLSRNIGACLIKDNELLTIGWNSPPRKVKHCNERQIKFYLNLDTNAEELKEDIKDLPNKLCEKCPRKMLGYKSGEGLSLCQALHAEMNTIIEAARKGISTLGAILYCWCTLPCKDCMIGIINAGISTIVCLEGPDYDDYSRILLNESGIELRIYKEKEL